MSGLFGGPAKGQKGDPGSNSGAMALVHEPMENEGFDLPSLTPFGSPILTPTPAKEGVIIGLPYMPETAESEIFEYIPERKSLLGFDPPMIMQDVPFNAGDFTASGGMTWTVEAGDIISFRYGIQENRMFISLFVVSTTVAAPLSGTLKVKIPNLRTAVYTSYNSALIVDNGIYKIGYVYATAASNLLSIELAPSGNFSASVNNTRAAFQIWIEV